MKNVKMRLAILGALGLASSQAFAAGTLCSQGAGSGGSAYIGASTCEITGLANDVTSPLSGYTLVVSTTRTIPNSSGAGNIGNVSDRIWRKPAATAPVTITDMCIIGTKVTLINADYNPSVAGVQYFEVRDIARIGFAASGNVGVGYFKQATNVYPLSRIGRTYTSVQAGGLPPFGSTAPIHPTLADVNLGWVDFATTAYFARPDGTTAAVSPMTYINTPCNSDSAATINATWVQPSAIRFRQTIAPFTEISISGYAPP